MRKPTSVLETKLDDLQQAKVVDWCLQYPYYMIAPMIEREFGLKVGNSQLGRFWQQVVVPHLPLRMKRAAGAAEAVAEESEVSGQHFDAAIKAQIKQKSFEILLTPGVAAKDVKALVSLAQKSRSQDLEERRIALEERKARQAEEAEGVVNSPTMTPEEKMDRLKTVFGM